MMKRGSVGIAFDGAAFFHHKAPAGPRDLQFIPQGPFRPLIGFGDEISRTLAAHLQVFNLAKVTTKAIARLARGALHHADQSGKHRHLV